MRDEEAGKPFDMQTLKSLIIDQEILLTTYTDQWELLYKDLASCIKIMLQMEAKERKSDALVTNSLRQDLDKANS